MLVRCYRCTALYTPGNWWRVRYGEGTSSHYRVLGKIDEAHCPICRQPPKTEPPAQMPGTQTPGTMYGNP